MYNIFIFHWEPYYNNYYLDMIKTFFKCLNNHHVLFKYEICTLQIVSVYIIVFIIVIGI